MSDTTVTPDLPNNKARVNTLRALWPFVLRHKMLFFAWLLALTASSAATLSLPLAVRQTIDQGFNNDSNIDATFALLFVVTIVLAIATAARFYTVSLLGERVVADLRNALYSHLIGLDQDFFERTRSGELVSRLSADTELLRSVIGSTMSVALRSGLIVLGSVMMLVVTSPRLAAYTLIGIPLFVLPLVLGGWRLEKISRQSQDRVADANTMASETLGAVRTVQSHARETYERGRFAAAVTNSVAAAQRRIGMQSIITAISISTVFGAIILVLWSGAHDVIRGTLSAGTLGQFVMYAMLGGGSVGAIAETWNELQKAAGGMSRIGELLDERATIVAPAIADALPAVLRGEIRFDDVTFRYVSRPDTAALEHFSLQVAPGETIALVGPSGAGKSTVFGMLLRFHDPQSGTIRIDDTDIRTLDPIALRETIALVPQAPTIFATTARDNIRYGRLEASDADIETATRAAEAHEFLSELPAGYDEQLGERGTRLSGGQQQRVVIARALLKNAPILLLDEATSALDAQSERAVQHALENLISGRTTLVIAHRLATVLKADRIVVMDRGRIVAQGTHAELIAQEGLYAELARLQFLD
ncbi:MAG: ABC transporter transmembrane domain-containing protein [Luteimonas sp.]